MINKRSDHKRAFRRPTLHIVNMFKILNVVICKKLSGRSIYIVNTMLRTLNIGNSIDNNIDRLNATLYNTSHHKNITFTLKHLGTYNTITNTNWYIYGPSQSIYI